MAARYRTSDGDMIDDICSKHADYASASQSLAIQAVYDANPGLADRGAILPAGLVIILPDLPKPETTPILRIWGAPA